MTINLCNFSPFVVYCLRVISGSVGLRVLIVSWSQQGIAIGHAHLVPRFHRTSSSADLDAREYGQRYQ